MSLVSEFANETLTDVAPGMLSATDVATRLDTPADPVMATPLIVETVLLTTGWIANNIANYVDRVNY
ncbi:MULTISPECIES: linaridin-like RiPP [unclassified Streptomyces]|jgi:hypothetical protein|uniref:linaridin-like RiPP n=1 Tax=unclassified Streptomyces TaxID=2593676 RepID=UPI00093C72BA|nr:linaridin-like RiPP [Streptomyces sp. CB01580]OKJ27840.1 hypothetical protein AMK22_30020 [Streptomyces sp. CB01580]